MLRGLAPLLITLLGPLSIKPHAGGFPSRRRSPTYRLSYPGTRLVGEQPNKLAEFGGNSNNRRGPGPRCPLAATFRNSSYFTESFSSGFILRPPFAIVSA